MICMQLQMQICVEFQSLKIFFANSKKIIIFHIFFLFFKQVKLQYIKLVILFLILLSILIIFNSNNFVFKLYDDLMNENKII